MPREKRKAALKTTKYADSAPVDSDDEGEEVGEMSGSGTSKGKRKARASVEEEDWSDVEEEAPARKKRKAPAKSTTKGKGKGRQGKLAAFNEMPLDVLYCIACYLDPVTLLNMSRANKAMHSLLASRSSIPIWQAARRTIFLPDLEASDLTEMQYASLLFERNCHFCGRNRASIVDYWLRRRWCKSCQKINLLESKKIIKQLDFLDESAIKLSLTTKHKPSGMNWQNKDYYCMHDVEVVSDKISALKDEISAAKGKDKRAEASAALDDYIKEREAIVKAAKKDAETLIKWEKSDIKVRQQAGKDAVAARKAAVTARLIALGYEAQDTKNLYSVWRELDQPTRLTDTIWSRISAKVIKAADQNKRDRLERERQSRQNDRRSLIRPYYDRLLAQEDADIAKSYPSLSSFVQLPHVEPFWRPEDSEVTQWKWDEALDDIKADVVLARRVIKVAYARTALNSLRAAAVYTDEDLVKKLQPPTRSVANQDSYGAGYRLAGYTLLQAQLQAQLNLEDSAPTMTEEQLDGVLSRFLTGQFYCANYGCKTMLPFPDIQHHQRALHGMNPTGSDSGLLGWLLKQFVAVLDDTGYDDHLDTVDKLEALGGVFDCKGCEASSKITTYSYLYGGVSGTYVPPTRGLNWSEMVSHYLDKHSTAHYYADRAPVPKIVLSGAGQALLSPGQLAQAKEKKAARQLEQRKKAAEMRAAAAEKRALEQEADERIREDEEDSEALLAMVQGEEADVVADGAADEESPRSSEDVGMVDLE